MTSRPFSLGSLCLFFLLLAACVHDGGRILHLRSFAGFVPTGPGEPPLLAEAELLAEGGRPPSLRLALVAADGSRQPVLVATEAEAWAAAEAVREGAALLDHLPVAMRSHLPSHERDCGEGTWDLPPTFGSLALSTVAIRDRRYGAQQVVLLTGEGFRHELRRFYLPSDGTLTLVACGDAIAAYEVSHGGGEHRVVDLALFDLHEAALRFFVAYAEEALARGEFDEAQRHLERARTFRAEPSADLWYAWARLAALRGEATSAVLAPLRRAIALEPTLYRMRARLSSDFDRIRQDADFVTLTRPRPLPGTRRTEEAPVLELPKR